MADRFRFRRFSHRDERGSGLVASFLGAVVFLAFMALAAHALVSLYATSVITSVTWDEARRVASSAASDDASVTAKSTEALRSRLSGFRNVTIEWRTSDGTSTGLSVGADRPMILPPGVPTGNTDRIERTVWVRNETLR